MHQRDIRGYRVQIVDTDFPNSPALALGPPREVVGMGFVRDVGAARAEIVVARIGLDSWRL